MEGASGELEKVEQDEPEATRKRSLWELEVEEQVQHDAVEY